jgi:hypothetical protein
MRNILALTFLVVGCGGNGAVNEDLTSSGSCTLNGAPCDPDIGCSAGVNWCGCTVDGQPTGGKASCLEVACVESDMSACPGASCHATSDCPGNQRCAFVGCASSSGVCTSVGACNQYAPGPPPAPNTRLTICDCDNKTVTVDWICGVEQPYAHVGACK